MALKLLKPFKLLKLFSVLPDGKNSSLFLLPSNSFRFRFR